MHSLTGSLFLLIWLTNTGSSSVNDEVQTKSCTHCAISKSTAENDEIPKEQLRKMRMEIIKEQILQKLRMKEPPKIFRPVIPEVLVNGQLLTSSQEEDSAYDHQFTGDDFYGTTQDVVIFPDNTSTHKCYMREELKPNSCFRFHLTRDITTRSVTAAELWIYKICTTQNNKIPRNESETSSTNVTYIISEITPHPKHTGFTKRVIAIEDTSSNPGWLKLEIAPAIRTWALRRHLAHVLEMSCTGCDSDVESPVSVRVDHVPFIVVHTDSWKVSARKKRSLTCTDDTTICCKENFIVNFRDINWHKWIIHPMSYNANFCRGSCLSDVSASRYHHTTVLRRYINKHSTSTANFTLALCCTPSRMKPLTLIYIDERNYIYKKALPNMIVESCDCA